MPVSAKYVREHPEKEYILDKPGHRYHGWVGKVEFSVTDKIVGIEIHDHTEGGAKWFIPADKDQITVKGNLGVTDPNNGNIADEGETYWLGDNVDEAAIADRMFSSHEAAHEYMLEYYGLGWKIFKVKTAFFFDTAEEVE